MLKEAMEFLFRSAEARALEKAAEQAKVKLLPEIPGYSASDRQVRCLLPGAQEITTIPLDPPLRNHYVESIGGLELAACKWAGGSRNDQERSAQPENAKGVCWVNRERIVLLLDDGERRERVTFELRETAGFRFLKESLPRSFTQAELILLLRRWKKQIAGAPELLAAVRRIKFRQGVQSDSVIQHGNESLGRSVELEISGADGIPETLVFSTPIFTNLGEEYAIGILLSIDTANQRFALEVIPDELETAVEGQLEEIRDELIRAVGIDVLLGRP